ncbi:hypothetical protein COT48_04820 [Candidatus Woesearchaeota archaeon CG08_land_8_20_14_0_20_47_9]|nr:MAG: hypothetical protein COT48_04820 [Candidatus Woesearchaeota archaeon CG08_land_8_20_14_0_20_47_9]
MESVGLLRAHRWNDCIKSSRPKGRGNAHELLSLILTFNQEDEFKVGSRKIVVKPLWKYLTERQNA